VGQRWFRVSGFGFRVSGFGLGPQAAAAAELREPIAFGASELPERVIGNYEVIQSQGVSGRTYADVALLGKQGGGEAGQEVCRFVGCVVVWWCGGSRSCVRTMTGS
jgi:hypothetical protein